MLFYMTDATEPSRQHAKVEDDPIILTPIIGACLTMTSNILINNYSSGSTAQSTVFASTHIPTFLLLKPYDKS